MHKKSRSRGETGKRQGEKFTVSLYMTEREMSR
nr:MAG TPA: hypothetical protein [Caudoviricetes sp.]